jgi:two-component system chemotaxis response regulator CheY
VKILLIDDSSMALNISSKLLEEAGHEIEKLNEPENALERLREFQPDLLICDVMMPNVNGFEVIRRVRADEQLSGLCIIMASAKAYEADRNKAKKLGADGYIVKPFTMEKFHSVMQSLHSMELSAWGVRGTLPAPQEGYIHYGGNTSCYSLELSPERYLVFDAGTGIKALGSALMKAGRTRITADVFITHPHWDHINAFRFLHPCISREMLCVFMELHRMKSALRI